MAAKDVIDFYLQLKTQQAAKARGEAAKQMGYAREAMERTTKEYDSMGQDLTALTPGGCSGLLYEVRVLKSRLDELTQAIAEALRLEADTREFRQAVEFDQANGAQ